MMLYSKRRTVDSLTATRCTAEPSGCQTERTYEPRFRSQKATLLSLEALAMMDHALDAATATTISVCIRITWVTLRRVGVPSW